MLDVLTVVALQLTTRACSAHACACQELEHLTHNAASCRSILHLHPARQDSWKQKGEQERTDATSKGDKELRTIKSYSALRKYVKAALNMLHECGGRVSDPDLVDMGASGGSDGSATAASADVAESGLTPELQTVVNLLAPGTKLNATAELIVKANSPRIGRHMMRRLHPAFVQITQQLWSTLPGLLAAPVEEHDEPVLAKTVKVRALSMK